VVFLPPNAVFNFTSLTANLMTHIWLKVAFGCRFSRGDLFACRTTGFLVVRRTIRRRLSRYIARLTRKSSRNKLRFRERQLNSGTQLLRLEDPRGRRLDADQQVTLLPSSHLSASDDKCSALFAVLCRNDLLCVLLACLSTFDGIISS